MALKHGPSGLSHRCSQKSLGVTSNNANRRARSDNQWPSRLSRSISSLLKVERSLWLAAKGVVLPSDIALCLSAVIVEVRQIASLATPYHEIDPGVRAVRRCCLRLRDFESEGASKKDGVALYRTECLLH